MGIPMLSTYINPPRPPPAYAPLKSGQECNIIGEIQSVTKKWQNTPNESLEKKSLKHTF